MTEKIQSTRGFGRMSTGLKILIVLTITLLPLGLIAILASIDTANAARQSREDSAQLLARISASRVSRIVARTAISLRAVATAVAFDERGAQRCENTLNALAMLVAYDAHYAIVGRDGRVLCATRDFQPGRITRPQSESSVYTRLDERAGTLSFSVTGANRNTVGIAELPKQALQQLTQPVDGSQISRITLSQRGRSLVLHDWAGGALPDNSRAVSTDAANGQLQFTAQYSSVPLGISEILSILLPLLMWIAAAVFGFLAVNRMVLRPMARLQDAVAQYADRGGEFTLPDTRTPAFEIRELGLAFQSVVEKLRNNERDLEHGLAVQRRLTREVHHRVKNNLQVVASLLNLHARAARTAETAAAYASIQRRVEALAIVQRNLFAENEVSRGINIRPVISELASGLQQSAPEHVAIMIMLELADVRVQQDVAVPIAFFVTELVELAMNCSNKADVEISITASEGDQPARLSVFSPALRQAEEHFAYGRYERVLTGLARQLRGAIETGDQKARYSLAISTL